MTDKQEPVGHSAPSTTTIRNEGTCDDCSCEYVTPWFAANELWNRVVPDRVALLCPNCFLKRAKAAGLNPTGWEIREEAWPAVAVEEASKPAEELLKVTAEKKAQQIAEAIARSVYGSTATSIILSDGVSIRNIESIILSHLKPLWAAAEKAAKEGCSECSDHRCKALRNLRSALERDLWPT
jgi:hypothetical protein